MGARAQKAESFMSVASTKMKDDALEAIANALVEKSSAIISQNSIDLDNAVANDMSVAMQDRLMLNEARIKDIADAVRQLTKLADPVGEVLGGGVRPNGLQIVKTRVPLGVIAIIYESRPNVTVDAATLCLKAGNAVILRGGKEAMYSNRCLVEIMREALFSVGFPSDAVQLVQDTSHESANELMKCSRYIDVLIPRGGAGLIKACVENATVPVIQTGTGNCHVFVDKSADLEMAVNIVDNGKTSRPSVCNAVESLLVHKDIAEDFLPMIKNRLDKHKVAFRGCPECCRILRNISAATDEDYATEFLDYVIAAKVVDSVDDAIEHINKYSTKHSECIVTRDINCAKKFLTLVDSAAVYVYASTRFTDGGVFGFGAEIGISTQKLHARGPMGLSELTTIKYLITGNGQIR